ncbi:GNAT family N-acetyltransferase [Endozoicomonas atrinae]|uniref:GNAT family N-acetyltransferase n=1 Tax=Endozoicomonas atrinae TaxID=1333660 RepID=UPI003B003D55
MTIQTRHSEVHDIPQIRALYAEKGAYSNTLQLPYPSLEKWQNFLGKENPNFISLVAIDQDLVLGQIGMEIFSNPRRRHVANIGMAVRTDAQGQGIGSQLLEAVIDLAENWMAIRRIELEVYTDNAAAIALYQKFGFEIEGTAQDYAFRNGRYEDVYLMARICGSTQ